MKKIFFIVTLGIGLSSCSKKIYQAAWQNQPVIIDGNCDEWEIPLRFYDKKSTLQYTVTNDSTNLYFCLRAVDESLQIKIRQAGMQIWFDTLGGQTKQAGLFFPYLSKKQSAFIDPDNHSIPDAIQMPDQQQMHPNEQNERISMQKNMPSMPMEFNTFKISGYKSEDSQVMPLQNNSGILLKISRDDFGILVYEACIPFSSFYSAGYHGFLGKLSLGITILINGVKMDGVMQPQNIENNKGGANFSMQGPGGMQMGGGGMPEGAMGGGMGGGMGEQGNRGPDQQDNSQLNKQNTIKLYLEVAPPKK